jgi:hypothetical protein
MGLSTPTTSDTLYFFEDDETKYPSFSLQNLEEDRIYFIRGHSDTDLHPVPLGFELSEPVEPTKFEPVEIKFQECIEYVDDYCHYSG